jgi:hypothetical protein
MFTGSTPSYVVPDNSSAIYDQISDRFGKLADETVATDAFGAGVKSQTEAKQQIDPKTNKPLPITSISGDDTGLGLRSKSFAKGANAVFSLQKKGELDTAMFQLQQKHRDDPIAFKKEWNDSFLPEFYKSIPTQSQTAFRLEATQRFNRVYQSLTEQATNLKDKQNLVTQLSGIDDLNSTIYNLVAAGQEYDKNTGKTLVELMAEAKQLIQNVSERNPKSAALKDQTLKQDIRSAEWISHYEKLSTEEKQKEFIDSLQRFAFDTSKMKGELLTPSKREQVIGLLKTRFNSNKTDNRAEISRTRLELKSTETALLSGVGNERNYSDLLLKAKTHLPEVEAEQWEKRIARGQNFAQEIKAIGASTLPAMTVASQTASKNLVTAKAQYEAGKISASDYNWEERKTDAINTYVNAQKRLINTDPWLILNQPNATKFNLKDEDEVFAARNWISQKTGIPIYSIPPMSKAQMATFKDDLNAEPDPTARAAKIQQLRTRLGNAQFADVFGGMELEDSMYPVAYARTPQDGANIIQAVSEGELLFKRADDETKAAINKAFDNKIGKALSFDIKQRENLRDAYTSLYLAYQQRGAEKPDEKALAAITTGRKIITLGNGETRLVNDKIDEASVQKAIEDVRTNWNALGILLPVGITVSDVSIDKFSPQFVGNKIMFFSPNKVPIKIRSKNGDRAEILQIDLSDYKVAVDTENNDPSDKPISWQGKTVKAPTTERGIFRNHPKGYDNADTYLDELAVKLYGDPDQKQFFDRATPTISNKVYEQQRLNAFVAVIRNGNIPDWAIGFINRFEPLEVNGLYRFQQLQKQWQEHSKQHTLAGGAVASPLELLMKLVVDVQKIKEPKRQALRRQR